MYVCESETVILRISSKVFSQLLVYVENLWKYSFAHLITVCFQIVIKSTVYSFTLLLIVIFIFVNKPLSRVPTAYSCPLILLNF